MSAFKFASKSEPSICIPRVFSNITWKRVKECFEDANVGVVERVDMVKKTNDKGEEFKRVFVHMREWSDHPDARELRTKLMSGFEVKMVYDEPWFWKLLKSNVPKPVFEKKRPDRPHKKIQLDLDGSGSSDRPNGRANGRATGRANGRDNGTANMETLNLMQQMQSQMLEMQRLIQSQQEELARLRESRATTPPYGGYQPPSPAYSPPPYAAPTDMSILKSGGLELKEGQSWCDAEEDAGIDPLADACEKPVLKRETASTPILEPKPVKKTKKTTPKKKSSKKLVLDVEED